MTIKKLGGVSDLHIEKQENPSCCAECGEMNFLPNLHVYEVSGKFVCDICAVTSIQENSQFGVGA